MRSSRTVVPTFLLVLGLVVAGAPADAQTRFGISGFTGYQSYAMDDINEVIADVNDELSSPGTLVQIEELTGDPSFGLGLKLDLGKTWRVYGEYEHLSDDTGGGNLIGSFNIDADASKDEIEALVAQSQKRSAVYDVITNPVNVTVNVA